MAVIQHCPAHPVVALAPTHLALAVHQVSPPQAQPPHVQLHALNTVLTVGWPTVTVTAYALCLQFSGAVKLACGAHLRSLVDLLQVLFPLTQHVFLLEDRLGGRVDAFDEFVELVEVVVLGVLDDLVPGEPALAIETLDFLEVPAVLLIMI